ncbi:MAG: acriflavin resistance protein, partial [Xanthobacteraceae bacterium]
MTEKTSLGIAGNLTRAFITSPLTPLFLLASLVLGIVALMTLPREEEPQISVPMVDIHVRADGLKAEDAVKLVTEPLETLVKSINGVEHVYSQTRDDGALITARFLVGTSADSAILRIHEKLRANLDRLPTGIPEPLIVGRGIDDVAIMVLTLAPKPGAVDRWSANDLTRVAREVQVAVSQLDNIGLTYLVGQQPEEIRVEPDPELLARAGLTLQALAGKVESANRAFAAATVRDQNRQIGLVAGQTLTGLSEIGNLLVTTRDGRPVYVRDVARVLLATETAETRVGHLSRNGQGGFDRAPAVSLAIAKRAGANAVTVAHDILAAVKRLEGTVVPSEVAIHVTRDYGETANEKANELLFHLALATISIVLLVWLAIGWREALVVAIVIPVTILLTLFAARIMGYTLNRVSLFALIFSIGILVDDAIVVIENIARHWAMKDGRSRTQAAIDAVVEVGNPTIIATLTVVAALLPMLFVSGMMGPYMSPIPANASAAMIFSFFVAVMVTPWLMLKFGKAHGGGEAVHGGGHGDGGILGRGYRWAAAPILATKGRAWMFLILVGIATLGSMTLFYTQHVTVKLLPFDNKPELGVVLDLPRGASVEETDRLLQQMAARLAGIAEIDSIQSHAGTAAPFNFNGLVRHSYLRSEPQMGDLQLNLVAKDKRKRASHGGEGGRAAARSAGHGDASRRDLRPRRRHPAAGGSQGPRGLRLRALHRRRGRQLRHHRRAPAADGGRRLPRIPPRRAERCLLHHPHALRRDDRRLFAPRWRTPAHPDPARAVEERPRPGRAGPVDTGAGQHPSGRPLGRRTRRRRQAHPRDHVAADLPSQRSRSRDGHRRTRRRLRGPALRHDRRAARDRRRGLGDGAEAGHRAQRPAGRYDQAGAAVGWRVGGHLGDVPRHGRRLHGGPARHLHPRGDAVRLVQAAAGDPHTDPADLHRHPGRTLALWCPLLGD